MDFHRIQKILKHYKVGIAGCGGTGSNCAVALARVGIGELVIVDFDVVEKSNLNRQYFFYDQIGIPKSVALKENIYRINPFVKVQSHIKFLDANAVKELFFNCDVIVEAFDKPGMKQMIIETVLVDMPSKYIVSGNGMAGWGNSHDIKPFYFDKLIICGDMQRAVDEENPPLAPRVGIVSQMMANEIISILLNKPFFEE